ncbi:MAG TPA: MmcQ/YjbR family DNA-binding protein [Puia sp.]|nr:MmcQ/YjbR family DNA-binding protein [Puia sp.]
MIDMADFTKLALSFPGTEERPHFHLRSFRVKKKIFATLWEKENRAMLKLPLIEQSVFCAYDKTVFFPVPGAWGKKGATFVELGKVKKNMLKDALTVAYNALKQK